MLPAAPQVFTSRILGAQNGDKRMVTSLMQLAREAGIEHTFVDPSEVVLEALNGSFCSQESRPACSDSRRGDHQCTPGTPDVISWKVQKHLKGSERTRPESPGSQTQALRAHGGVLASPALQQLPRVARG